MQNRKKCIQDIIVRRMSGRGELASPRVVAQPRRANSVRDRANRLLLRPGFPQLCGELRRGVVLGFILAILQLAVPNQGHALPNPIEGTLGGGRVTTGAAPEGVLSAGTNFTCGLKSDGTLACWGYNGNGQLNNIPSGIFSQASSGGAHTCGIRNDGTLTCWGDNYWGQLNNIPGGTFSQVSAAGGYTCGLRDNGTLACWGDNRNGQASPPSNTFNQISAGEFHACGLKSDGTLACWGRNIYGEATPLSGTFSQVSAGTWHACGLKNDGTLACWGMDDSGSTVPPSGTFSQVSAGSNRTCGVRTDGTLVCWGYEAYGEAPILSLTPSSLVSGVIGNAYSQSLALTTAVYTPPLPQTFTLTSGSLPPGLSLSTTGLLSGTPTTGGTSSFSLRGEDANGFTATQNYTLTIGTPDTTPPVITPTVSGTVGNNGWYKSTVNLMWSVVDSESSVTTQVGCGPQSVATDTTGVTFTCQATSSGGTASQSVTIKRDATAPVLSPTVSPNPVFLNGAATASPGGSDTTSGLAAASCNPATTSSAGSFTASCTATDNAGNVANASANYVVRYQFLGFLSPLSGASYKAGATIRVKFRLADASGAPISDAVAQGLVTACRVKIGLDTATGCAGYDARNDLFQFDVKVPKNASAGTHQIVMQVLASDNTVVNTATTAVVIR